MCVSCESACRTQPNDVDGPGGRAWDQHGVLLVLTVAGAVDALEGAVWCVGEVWRLWNVSGCLSRQR